MCDDDHGTRQKKSDGGFQDVQGRICCVLSVAASYATLEQRHTPLVRVVLFVCLRRAPEIVKVLPTEV